MPCKSYTFEECLELHGLENFGSNLNSTEFEYDAELLCREKKQKVVEYISFATFAIVVYVLSNCYIQIAEFHNMLKKSRIWGKGKTHAKEGSRAIVESAIICLCIGIMFYVSSTVLVQILTKPLDSRMNTVVVGISQLFSAVVFLMMSVHVPQWFGIYYSNKNTMVSFASERGIRFYLSWNISKQLFSMFFFNLFFSCTGYNLSVIVGILLGLVVGILSIRVSMLARSKKYAHRKTLLAIIVILFYTIISWICFLAGTVYISEIWARNPNTLRTSLISLAWVVVMIITHFWVKKWTERKIKMGVSMRFKSEVFRLDKLGSIVFSAFPQENPGDKTPEGAEVADTDFPNDKVDQNNDATKTESIIESEGKNAESKQRSVTFQDKDSDVGSAIEKNDLKSSPRPGLYLKPEDAPSYWSLFMHQMADAYPFFCCCLSKKYGLANISQKRLDYIDHAREKTKLGRFLFEFKRFLWYLSSFACFFLTICNIGATYQQCAAKRELSSTFDLLYPPDYLTGTMCAWDVPGPNATIKTFDSLKEVQDVDYEVIHCGACGTCSNWNDITLQYTTREVLAGITKVCAQKSIGRKTNFSDPEDPVVMCNRQRVGFTPECAMSWAWDEVNTKNNALFVFIQANVANYFSDMEVTYQDITLATIDEAISGPRFVSEVGATRRRMNIKSDIMRPITQQCTIIKQDWDEIFVDEFRPPVGGTYKIQRPGQPTEKRTVIGQDSVSSSSSGI